MPILKNTLLSLLISASLLLPQMAFAAPRIKDIVDIEGIRDNLLVGYGLVVGLNGTGDNLSNAIFTQKGITDFLERLGVSTRGATLKTKNIAAVTVTAVLPPFARHGSKIDITVSTLGDAKSLQDGTLLATPLVGADGQVYAVAQGAIANAYFIPKSSQSGTSNQNPKLVTTNASISDGAIIEKEITFSMSSMETINLALHNPDITTALNIASTVNVMLGPDYAKAIDPGTVELRIPDFQRADIVDLLSRIEQLRVSTDQVAKIVIDQGSGTIVIGENVSIDPVAIAQGNLSITVNSQPFAQRAAGVFAPNAANQFQNADSPTPLPPSQVAVLQTGITLGDLVSGLNALGVAPQDLITILHTVRSAGALPAELIVR